MAYDPNSAYEPPRRNYHGQQQQMLPQPAMYSTVNEPYDRYGAQGDHQLYVNHVQHSQGYLPHQEQSYDDGLYQQNAAYNQAYDRGHQQNGYSDYQQGPYAPQRKLMHDDGQHGSYDRQYQAQVYREEQHDHAYDPRYQPRAPPQGQPRVQNGSLRGQYEYSREWQQLPQAQPSYHDDPPRQTRQARHPPPPQQLREQMEQRQHAISPQQGYQGRPASRQHGSTQHGSAGYDDHIQANMAQQSYNTRPTQQPRPKEYSSQVQSGTAPHGYDGRSARAQHAAPAVQQGQEPAEDRMAAWKAREKAKMHEALSPETIAQDNAFPTFPNAKRKDRSTDRSGGQSAMSHRSNETFESQRPHAHRENSYNTERIDSKDLQSAKTEHNAKLSSPEISHRWPLLEERPPSSRSQVSQHQAHNALPSQMHEQRPEQWPIVDQPTVDGLPATAHGLDPARAMQSQQQTGFDPKYGEARAMPQQFQARAPPSIDTRVAKQSSTSSSRQPLSPSGLPALSSIPHRSRHPKDTQPLSPTSPESQSVASPVSAYTVPKTWMQQQAEPQPMSKPRTREEQIEADMPDFDSAAPGQTSSLHKRNQTVDRHLAETPIAAPPPMPAVPVNLPQQLNGTNMRFPGQEAHSNQQRIDEAERPHAGGPEYQRPKQGSVSSSGNHAQEYDFGYPYQNSWNDRGYHHDSATMQPPQAPFATTQPVRRSMDDARQMPYRAAPAQQSGPPQIRPQQRVNGFPSPQNPRDMAQRPDLDRNYTNQTVRSDPGQQRFAGTPPVRPGLQAPPAVAPNGQPLTQQRSAPGVPQSSQTRADVLPHHPVPVRAGLQQPTPQPSRPPPVRTYNNPSPASHERQPSADQFSGPVTQAQLNQLRANVEANPHSPRQGLLYAKKLVEAASVLATENGRADAKTTNKNREKYLLDAHKRIKKLVQAGYPEAQFYLADCYGQGLLGLEVDTKEAFNLYQAAAKAGHPQAAYRTAVCCEMGPEEGGGTRKDLPKAVQWYRRAAVLGDNAAMYKIGVVLLKGLLGEQKNVGEAVTWLKRAVERADQDNPHALHELAGLYDSSNTSPEVRNKIIADDKYALELFQQAAGMGYKISQFRLGQAYEYGNLGLSIDNRLSITWYTKAAAQGEHQAELALSGWYLTGADGILEHNDTEAYLWARKAAVSEPPLAKAMFAMGYFTENGIGCPASLEEAKKWYGRAASYRFPKALERLEDLKRNGGKGNRNAPSAGKLGRKDQKRDEAECAVM